MDTSFANSRQLAANLAVESAKLEEALDQQIGKLGTLKQLSAPPPPANVRIRKATLFLFWIGLALACLTAFSFGFLAGFH